MQSSKIFILFLIAVLATGCHGGGSSAQATLTAIAVTPLNPTISQGANQQFLATGTYSDSSTQDITSSVSWSSSNTSVATISNTAGTSGNAVAVTTGSTTITAASGSLSVSTTLKVTRGGGVTGNNVLQITVNGSLCSAGTSAGYINKPCVSITVCNPGDFSTCQTIDDILLDTGSFGLRIFKSVLNPAISLSQIAGGSGSLAECTQFGDGTSTWGPVQLAGLTLASESTITVPIQVIDSTFADTATLPTSSICPGAYQAPATAGFNGILGVGIFSQDCGSGCANSANNRIYYSCTFTNSVWNCTGTAVGLSSQVQNPVALLPRDNNGVIVELPSVSAGGAVSVNGSLILGIGTQTNNTASGVTAYAADPLRGEIATSFNSVTYGGIIDTGSNGLFFVPPSASLLPDCPTPDAAWFCPASSVPLVATNASASGSTNGAVSFQISNFVNLVNTPNFVFSDIGGAALNQFDWGLPFFFGRSVYVGIERKSSSLGSGPYWAY